MLLKESRKGAFQTPTDNKRGDRIESRQVVAMAPAMDFCRAVDVIFRYHYCNPFYARNVLFFYRVEWGSQ